MQMIGDQFIIIHLKISPTPITHTYPITINPLHVSFFKKFSVVGRTYELYETYMNYITKRFHHFLFTCKKQMIV